MQTRIIHIIYIEIIFFRRIFIIPNQVNHSNLCMSFISSLNLSQIDPQSATG